MEFQPSEIVDKMSIVRLKIERVGEPQLKGQYAEYGKAVEELESNGTKMREEWFDELYIVNGQLWDRETEIFKLVHAAMQGDSGAEKKSDEELERIGLKYIEIGDLMAKRVKIKNKITRECGAGFIEVKKDHCADQ